MLLRTAASKNDYSNIHALYLSAFPKEERAPFFLLKRKALQRKGMFLIAEEENTFLGFLHIVIYQDLVYLVFFAMNDAARNHGYGSKALQLLKEHFPDKKILIARETLDPVSDNYAMRVRRYGFYCRNGYTDLPCTVIEAGVSYDTMSIGDNVEPEEYNQLVRAWIGPWMVKLIHLEMKRK